jgi:voltage-gated potassium channel
MRETGRMARPRVIKNFSWGERMRQAVANRRVFPYLALMTFGLALLSGFVVTLVDRRDFPTYGTAVWWAVVTLATVGYGDVVPHTAWGRIVGSVVIVIGVTFISFLTATVTSYFVSAEQEDAAAEEKQRHDKELAATMETLRRIESRLDAIESKLDR